MSRIIPNANSFIGFTTVAPVSLTAPTAAEVAASTNLTPFVVSLNPATQGNAIPTPTLDSLFDRSIIGTRQGSFTGDFYRDDSADTAWTTLAAGVVGYFYVSRFGGTGTNKMPVAGQQVEVWPVAITARTASNMTSNTVQTFTVTAAVPNIPSEGVSVVSGTPTAPSVPLNLTATQGATGAVTLDWDAPASNGGAAITTYTVYKSTTSAVAGFAAVSTNITPTSPNTATARNLTSLGTVATWFYVTATNSVGEGAQSNTVTLTVV